MTLFPKSTQGKPSSMVGPKGVATMANGIFASKYVDLLIGKTYDVGLIYCEFTSLDKRIFTLSYSLYCYYYCYC